MNPLFRAWTPAELALLRQRYPEEGAKALARDLGRTVRAVRAQAQIQGVTCNARIDPEKVVALWQQGLSHHAIARRLGCSSGGVWHALVGAGEVVPGTPTPGRQRGARAQRRWLKANGYRSLAHRRDEKRAYESELAWPGCGPLGPAQRRLLDDLAGHGPSTTRALAGRLGHRWRTRPGGTRYLHPTLWALRDRGLVARQGFRAEGPSARPGVWGLAGPAAEAVRNRKERSDLR